MPSSRIQALCDRDDKSAQEVSDFEKGGDIVLAARNLESYLFADDVIEALAKTAGNPDLLPEALKLKSDALSESVARGNAADDLKSAAGQIYVGLKKLFDMTRCGNNTDTFMRDTLAPLVKPGMPTHSALVQAIIAKLLR